MSRLNEPTGGWFELSMAQRQRIIAAGWKPSERCASDGSVLVPLSEWLTQRAEEAHAAGRLLEAAQVPEHTDQMLWMKAMREVITCAAALSQVEDEAGPATKQAWSDRLHDALADMSALRMPPKPLPTGPGWWWKTQQDNQPPMPVWVDDDLRVPLFGGSGPVSDYTWLTRDGACVRCEPPGGGE